MKKVRLKLTLMEGMALREILARGLESTTRFDRKDAVLFLVMILTEEVRIKLDQQLCVHKSVYNVNLSLAQAKALCIAYERQYIPSQHLFDKMLAIKVFGYLAQQST